MRKFVIIHAHKVYLNKYFNFFSHAERFIIQKNKGYNMKYKGVNRLIHPKTNAIFQIVEISLDLESLLKE